ncbi:Hypothetical protein NTJ_14969 [Nesidiocoris tenuis]|uniref:Uncharacterized protein n=1 Tax=Nesidiocoris tenuis TaxID=355587 RepID=A0ABN7BER2_9HEMI|nr:Hypothetical protein NTJ_14969 [Nesidiocoris tenuis]
MERLIRWKTAFPAVFLGGPPLFIGGRKSAGSKGMLTPVQVIRSPPETDRRGLRGDPPLFECDHRAHKETLRTWRFSAETANFPR